MIASIDASTASRPYLSKSSRNRRSPRFTAVNCAPTTHIARLGSNTAQSIETSSLHLDLISDLKRINSHICSIAYPILEQAGVLAKTRLKEAPAPGSEVETPLAADAPDPDGWKKHKPHTA